MDIRVLTYSRWIFFGLLFSAALPPVRLCPFYIVINVYTYVLIDFYTYISVYTYILRYVCTCMWGWCIHQYVRLMYLLDSWVQKKSHTDVVWDTCIFLTVDFFFASFVFAAFPRFAIKYAKSHELVNLEGDVATVGEMYVCVCVYIYVYDIDVCIYLYTCMCICMFIDARKYFCIIYTCIFMCVYIYMYVYVYVCVFVRCTCKYVHDMYV